MTTNAPYSATNANVAYGIPTQRAASTRITERPVIDFDALEVVGSEFVIATKWGDITTPNSRMARDLDRLFNDGISSSKHDMVVVSGSAEQF